LLHLRWYRPGSYLFCSLNSLTAGHAHQYYLSAIPCRFPIPALQLNNRIRVVRTSLTLNIAKPASHGGILVELKQRHLLSMRDIHHPGIRIKAILRHPPEGTNKPHESPVATKKYRHYRSRGRPAVWQLFTTAKADCSRAHIRSSFSREIYNGWSHTNIGTTIFTMQGRIYSSFL